MQRALARVEQDRREPVDVAELLACYGSEEADVRAGALRRSCPCHVPWDVYEQVRKRALRLRRDPDPRVRALANHLEEDARMIRLFEARVEEFVDRDDKRAQRQNDRRRRPGRRTRDLGR